MIQQQIDFRSGGPSFVEELREWEKRRKESELMEEVLQAVRVAGCEDRWHAENIQTSLKNGGVATTTGTSSMSLLRSEQ
jgi:hypothetical protein